MFTMVGNVVLPSPPDSRFFKYPFLSLSLVKSISIDSTSFKVSCTINTCGLPEDKSISTTKTAHFESSSNPDSVIAFFKINGFSDSDISEITDIVPDLLHCSVDKTLKPKLEFLKSQGLSDSELAKPVCFNPIVLMASNENEIIPYFDVIKSIVHTDAKLLALLKRSLRVLTEDPQIYLLPNVALLRAQGVPADKIVKSLVARPRSFLTPASYFREVVEEVKQMKFHPKQYMFLVAVQVLTCTSKSCLEAKFDAYGKWGLSRNDVQLMFRKSPQCLMISETNIMSTMNYFVNEMGYTPSEIAKYPAVLNYSLERRIIPRGSVINILKAKGLVGNRNLSAFLPISEEDFLRRFVVRFVKEVPEVLEYIYNGKGR